MLSRRGKQKVDEPLRPDFELFERAQQDLYAPDNPDGAIPLCIAENLLLWPRMRDRLKHITAQQPWPEWIAAYAPLPGAPDFRKAVAEFVVKFIAGRPLKEDHFCASAGATAVVEVSAMCLGDPGQYAVFPAPAYQAYAPDISNKAGLRRYDIQRYDRPFDTDFHPLTTDELDRVYAELGTDFRLLVLTQPDNPTGAVYSRQQLQDIAKWCIRHAIHLVVNEIYALSQFERTAPGITNSSPFQSFLPLLEDLDSPYLHWWYSFSKDFGISGFRVGLLYTRNADLRKAYTNYNAPHQVSNPTQWLLAELLGDHDWIERYRVDNQHLLTQAYLKVTDLLHRKRIPFTAARGSLFVWADFSKYLSAPTQQAATEFWEGIFGQTGVLLTAPGGLGQPDFGWYRIVYSAVSPEALSEAITRLDNFLSD